MAEEREAEADIFYGLWDVQGDTLLRAGRPEATVEEWDMICDESDEPVYWIPHFADGTVGEWLSVEQWTYMINFQHPPLPALVAPPRRRRG